MRLFRLQKPMRESYLLSISLGDFLLSQSAVDNKSREEYFPPIFDIMNIFFKLTVTLIFTSNFIKNELRLVFFFWIVLLQFL